MTNLRVTLIQSEIHWENIDANIAMFEEKIWNIGVETDVIILPEMFSTGFSMNAKSLAEPMNSKTFRWMKQLAAQTKALLIGSCIIREGARYFNRLLAMFPDGTHNTYDKKHLFRFAGEEKYYSPGTRKLFLEWKGWKIFPLICYDLRFPVWSRNKMSNNSLDYDLLIYLANWPAPRLNAWDTLLSARAIENFSYCAGVNRIGVDGYGAKYLGHSAVYNYKGEAAAFLDDGDEIETVSLSKEKLESFREKVKFHLDADGFEIN